MMRWDAMQLPDGTPGVKKTPIGKKDNVYFTAFDNKSKGNGYFMRENRKGKLLPMKELIMEPDFALGYLNKAKDANVITYTKGNFVESNNLWVTKDMFKSSKKLTSANPQQANYNWGTCESVYWTAHDGRELEGLLYKPENFDASKKYPMVVYFYETSSQYKHAYRKPAVSRSTINISYFVSNGYLVFMPDIHYTVGHPGKSAYNCIVSGVEALCKNSWVDKDNIAIQGQSWGGYQVAYLVTQTDMFKCAGSGAPVANMTSAYGGIRWGSGVVRHFQYEHTQSRIGKTLWDEGGFDLYVENSPLFFADKVNTPLLIMHNDDDGAVPWYQGIEYFMALRRLEKPVWMLQYNGEAHNIRARKNRKDITIRLQQFFDHYLKGEPMPEWMKNGIPMTRKGQEMGTGYAE
jgi:dipeptidyl aminopeptidase/acylaminoacyl peptidase